MARIKKVEPLVHKVLIDKPLTRADDFLLVLEVYKESFIDDAMSIGAVLENHELIGLPSFGSITRARRKLQAKYPELRNETSAEIRAKEETEYRAYALNS